ncbi:MAG: ATP-binding protein [Candidatus Dormiibacterota bacterium]
MEAFAWPLLGEFVDRAEDLEHLDRWWEGRERRPVALIGRRRVGKSWLLRRLAHGKPAVLLVAEQLPRGAQLARFARLLEPALGVRPDLPDIESLFRVIYRAGRTEKILVAIDEFPWLLGPGQRDVRRALSTIQAVGEEEQERSNVKLILCGSHVGQMEALFGERNPMHGRLLRTEVRPLAFPQAALFFPGCDAVDAFERFSIAGGMPLYLGKLRGRSVRAAVSREVLDRYAPLWNEGRSILEQELREPRVYFAILELLAGGDKELNAIAAPMRMGGGAISKYLDALRELRLVERRTSFSARASSRAGHWRLQDPFLRFWFRFVFPHQSDLESGLRPADLYDAEIAPALADHVAPVFEDWCRAWLRTNRGTIATSVGAWWGPAANHWRRSGERSSEEIDAVGASRHRVTLVAECKWTARALGPAIVAHLDTYKVPALREAGLEVVEDPRIVLFSKSGYTQALRALARRDDRIELVDVAAELGARPAGV